MPPAAVLGAPPTADTTTDPKSHAEGEKRLYRLLRGRHCDRQGPPTTRAVAGATVPIGGKRTYQADIRAGVFPEFESVVDLTGPAYCPPGFRPKYELVKGDAPRIVHVDPTKRLPGETTQAYLARVNALISSLKGATESTARAVEQKRKGVDTMTEDELIEFAGEEEIDLGDARTLTEMRKAVKAALK